MRKTFFILILTLSFTLYSCGNKSTSQVAETSTNLQLAHEDEIEEFNQLVNEVISLQYQYVQTNDESIMEQGNELCYKMNEMAYKFEQYMNNGELSIEQHLRINEIIERLPR